MSCSSELHPVSSIVKPVFSFPVVATNTPEKVNEAEAEASTREAQYCSSHCLLSTACKGVGGGSHSRGTEGLVGGESHDTCLQVTGPKSDRAHSSGCF